MNGLGECIWSLDHLSVSSLLKSGEFLTLVTHLTANFKDGHTAPSSLFRVLDTLHLALSLHLISSLSHNLLELFSLNPLLLHLSLLVDRSHLHITGVLSGLGHRKQLLEGVVRQIVAKLLLLALLLDVPVGTFLAGEAWMIWEAIISWITVAHVILLVMLWWWEVLIIALHASLLDLHIIVIVCRMSLWRHETLPLATFHQLTVDELVLLEGGHSLVVIKIWVLKELAESWIGALTVHFHCVEVGVHGVGHAVVDGLFDLANASSSDICLYVDDVGSHVSFPRA